MTSRVCLLSPVLRVYPIHVNSKEFALTDTLRIGQIPTTVKHPFNAPLLKVSPYIALDVHITKLITCKIASS